MTNKQQLLIELSEEAYNKEVERLRAELRRSAYEKASQQVHKRDDAMRCALHFFGLEAKPSWASGIHTLTKEAKNLIGQLLPTYRVIKTPREDGNDDYCYATAGFIIDGVINNPDCEDPKPAVVLEFEMREGRYECHVWFGYLTSCTKVREPYELRTHRDTERLIKEKFVSRTDRHGSVVHLHRINTLKNLADFHEFALKMGEIIADNL